MGPFPPEQNIGASTSKSFHQCDDITVIKHLIPLAYILHMNIRISVR